IYSALSVVFSTFFLEILPVISLSDDIMLNAVVGGVISGAAVGISLKWGASTGGMDIVAMILSRLNDKPIGIYFLILIGVIIFVEVVFFVSKNSYYYML